MSAIFETEFRDIEDAEGNKTKASTAKLVLLALADHANDAGEGAYPSLERLAKKTALTRHCIIETFDALKHNGLISYQGVSRLGTSNYTVNPRCYPGADDGGNPRLLAINGVVISDNQGSNPGLPEGVISDNPNRTLITNKPPNAGGLTELEHAQANAQVDAMIANSRKKTYANRDKIPEPYLAYSDCYNRLTGQEPTKRVISQWLMEFSLWQAEGLSVNNIEAAYKHAMRPEGGFLVARPGSLTNTAVAMKSKGHGQGLDPELRFTPYVDPREYVASPGQLVYREDGSSYIEGEQNE
jgi:hypothetical protein